MMLCCDARTGSGEGSLDLDRRDARLPDFALGRVITWRYLARGFSSAQNPPRSRAVTWEHGFCNTCASFIPLLAAEERLL